MPMPRSAILATKSRKLSLQLKYQRTHRITISWLKCRPLNSSSIGTNRGICPSSSTPGPFCTRAACNGGSPPLPTSQLFAIRFLLGVGESVVTPASMRWIRFHFQEKQRGLAVGLYMTGTKIGPAIGAWIAGKLILAYGWKPMFWWLGLGSLVWLIPWLTLVSDDDRQIEKAAKAANGPRTGVSFARLLASPVIWGTIVGTFCYMYFVYFCMTWMPAYFVEKRHLSLDSMGLYTMFSFGGMATVAALSGWGADRMIARGGDPVGVRKAFTIAGFVIASTEVFGAMSD